MKSRATRWGNSLGVRVPKILAGKAGLRVGDEVEKNVSGPGHIEIRSRKAALTIEQLVAGITRKNRHSEIDWGKPTGREV
ncbi:MAG TPA: AbrB/MazE/SpoVT family DNA-binding domain-containing protein [Terriglobales bacterium]|nr:AbrB/MazE/SpoVT family DNA-binding domain-containing protein [Terriglobales bacterium]